MESIPKLINEFKYFEKSNFYSSVTKDLNDLYSIIYELVNGSCCAIIAGTDILYNSYLPSQKPNQILMEDLIRQQFGNNPQLIVRPYPELNIQIYMFYKNPWSVHITYYREQYILTCFK
jgi:hypothetical protein